MSRAPKERKVTPADIARYGHIAAKLRAFMVEHQLKAGDVNERLGLKRPNTAIYNWLNAKAAPGPATAARMAAMMGIMPQQLLEKDAEGLPATVPEVVERQPYLRSVRAPQVLTFGVAADGMATLRLDVALPIDQAAPLLRMLLDAGLVIGGGTKVDADD